MLLANLTFKECENYIQKLNPYLIIPLGTCEQHGYHLPLNFDIIVAEYMAEYLSSETQILVAPTINYGVNLPCDKKMTGTTSLSKQTFKEILLSITGWWRVQGFTSFVFISYHGDPYHLEAVNELGKDSRLIEPSEIDYTDILEMQSTIRHACEAETSVALYLWPELVRKNEIREYDIAFDNFKEYLFHKNDKQPPNYVGCLGFPSYATEKKGGIIVQRMKELTLNMCRDFLTKLS